MQMTYIHSRLLKSEVLEPEEISNVNSFLLPDYSTQEQGVGID